MTRGQGRVRLLVKWHQAHAFKQLTPTFSTLGQRGFCEEGAVSHLRAGSDWRRVANSSCNHGWQEDSVTGETSSPVGVAEWTQAGHMWVETTAASLTHGLCGLR